MNLKNQKLLVRRAKEGTLGRVPRHEYSILADGQKVSTFFAETELNEAQKLVELKAWAEMMLVPVIGLTVKKDNFLRERPRTIIHLGKVS